MGVEIAEDTTSSENSMIIDAKEDGKMKRVYSLANNYSLRPTDRPYIGFARRDDKLPQDMVGARYLNDAFKKRVREMVEESIKTKQTNTQLEKFGAD